MPARPAVSASKANESCHSGREQKVSNQHLQCLRLMETAAQCGLQKQTCPQGVGMLQKQLRSTRLNGSVAVKPAQVYFLGASGLASALAAGAAAGAAAGLASALGAAAAAGLASLAAALLSLAAGL